MADKDMNPAGEMRDPDEMIRQMKTKAREEKQKEQEMLNSFNQAPMPTRGAQPGEPGSGMSESIPRIGAPGTGFDDPITSASMKLASGIYEGAGGYEYEVMPGGEIKILKAPKDRGVGVTLKLGHPAHEAIFDELSEGGAKPKDMSSEPADKSDDDRDRAEESKSLSEMVKDEKDESKIAMSPEAKTAFDRVKVFSDLQ